MNGNIVYLYILINTNTMNRYRFTMKGGRSYKQSNGKTDKVSIIGNDLINAIKSVCHIEEVGTTFIANIEISRYTEQS